MSENCSHDCSSCSQNCSERKSLIEKPHETANIKNVIAVVSGKGGVGKSLVTSLLSVLMQRKGYQTAILDADITGPSIPKAFGSKDKVMGNDMGLFPVLTKSGIKIMSLNLLMENETDPVIWRGPVITGTVKQFWTDVLWDDVDYMFVDMPPGTGDVPLTVFQSLPIKGIVVVSSPQELVSMIVQKVVKMAEMMNIPIIGIVENMSYFKCDSCNKEHHIFGESHIEEIAEKYNIQSVSKLPMDPNIAKDCDMGNIECFDENYLDNLADLIEEKFNK